MAKITKVLVERTHEPGTNQLFVRDDELKGFALRVTAGGAKSFVVEGRIRGRFRRVTLGQWPTMSVFEARQKALEFKAEMAKPGGDPTSERDRARNEPTFGDLAKAYVERHSRPHKDSSKRDERRIESHFRKWRTRKLSDIGRDEVVRVQHSIAEAHGPVESNRSITLLRAIFNKARDWRMFVGENPALRLKLFREERRERFLSPDELKRVNKSLAQEPNEYWRAYFALCLMLGTRKSELLSARWQDIDLSQRTLRIPETKAGRSHLLPLPAPAVAILEGLSSRGTGEWVFPGTGKTGHLVEVKSAWTRIRKRAGVTDVTVHDLRRTLGSWLAAQGYNLPLIGRVLNHHDLSSTEIYAKIALDPVRAALEQTAALMVGPSSEAVVVNETPNA